MKTQVLFSICSGLIPAFAFNARDDFSPSSYAKDDVITRDVAVIGGGGSGTYAAINLRKLGKSVVVVERDAELGGHTNTYLDPTTGTNVDYGAQAYWNISVARDYFAHFNITLGQFAPNPLTRTYLDFQTGESVSGVEASNDFSAYVQQLEKYPTLYYSWELPTPVPEDLLLPFKDFITKYDLQDIAFSVYFGGPGYANILDQLTVNVLKMIDNSYISAQQPGGGVGPVSQNNSELYVKARNELGRDALLSSMVVSARRPTNGRDGVRLVVQTPSGRKLINASKLLVTIPTLVDDMRPFDLDTTETNVFSQWHYSAYYVMLIRNTGLPSGFQYANANESDTTYNIPQLPGPYHITESRVPGLFYSWYGSPTELTEDEIKSDVTNVIGRLRAATNSTVTSPPDYIEFKSHTPFKLVVSAESLTNGFYDQLEGLQGYRGTWYTGAAMISHDVSIIWNYTQALLPELAA
ncbi:hypothetical protein AAE478_005335 [Parahypoxylon ruwenzoriense]